MSVADPDVAKLGGSYLVASFSGVAAVANLLRAVESGHVLGKIVIDLEQAVEG